MEEVLRNWWLCLGSALCLPLITFAEAFAFLPLRRQASVYTSKSYMHTPIKAFEHINLVSGITASELKQNKSGVQCHCKWKYFSYRSPSGWQLCFAAHKSCISWDDSVFPSLLPALPRHAWVPQSCAAGARQSTARLPKACISVPIHWEGMLCRLDC